MLQEISMPAAILLQNPREHNQEQDGTAYCGCGVGYGLGGENAPYAHQAGKSQGQRDEQDNLAQQGNEYRQAGLAEGDEHVLEGPLQRGRESSAGRPGG